MTPRLARSSLLLWLIVTALALASAPTVRAEITDSCVACHAALPENLGEPAKAQADDVHASHGISCAACHGGDPTVMDLSAMDPERGYIGKPSRQQIPDLCAQCHSDPAYMRRINPSLPTNQRERYWTSVHGQRLKEGDERVATCIDCHGAHGVRPPSRADSPVYPVNVPHTCGACHSDQHRMEPYGIPTDQEASYRKSVHGKLLFEKRDLSAPTCATCHDKHGASPPDVTSIDGVCGMCHVNNTAFFIQSPHKKAFDDLGLPECVACHGKHNIQHPTDAMVGVEGDGICSACHDSASKGYAAAVRMHAKIESLKTAMAQADAALTQAEKLGMEVSDARYDFHDVDAATVKVRTAVHRFAPDYLDQVAAPGLTLAAATREKADAAIAEARARRWQLLLPLAVIGVVMLLLALKLRQLERAGSL